MEELDRPSFSAEVRESIEREQYSVHKVYWNLLDPLGVSVHSQIGPLQPKQPLYLQSTIGNYACALFDIEAKRYPPDDRRLSQWFAALACHIETIILEKLAELTRSTGFLMHTMEYHLAKNEIVAAIRAALAKHIATYAQQSAPARSKVAAMDDPVRIVQTKNSNPKPDRLKTRRFTGMISSASAAKKMEDYIDRNGLGITDFAAKAGTTDRTLRSFRKTGRVRRDIFDSIAKAMQLTKEELLKQ